MAWIESHQSLLNHPKTLAAVARLKVDRYKFLGHLHALWWWAVDVVDLDGTFPAHCSNEVIAIAAGWSPKFADQFVEALTESGFINTDDCGRHLHDWYDYAGKLTSKRVANKQRMRDARASHVQGLQGGEDREDTTQQGQQGQQGGEDTTKPPPGGAFASPHSSTSWDFALSLYRQNIGEPDNQTRAQLRGYFEKQPDWVVAAINESSMSAEPGFGYFKRIMDACLNENRPPSSLKKTHAASRR